MTNEDSVNLAWKAIQAFKTEAHMSDDEVIIDLLTDLRHWCEVYAVDYEAADRQAEIHFNSEQ